MDCASRPQHLNEQNREILVLREMIQGFYRDLAFATGRINQLRENYNQIYKENKEITSKSKAWEHKAERLYNKNEQSDMMGATSGVLNGEGERAAETTTQTQVHQNGTLFPGRVTRWADLTSPVQKFFGSPRREPSVPPIQEADRARYQKWLESSGFPAASDPKIWEAICTNWIGFLSATCSMPKRELAMSASIRP
ncbi:hypothetical protein VE03_10301 [Pseudogymnoascus sp. 23342-1-I1]|nr:hypothetical protein VE03_10301 [Pseudogymnoascus sp. 23342-1-I1]